MPRKPVKGSAAVLPTAPAYSFGVRHGEVKIQGDISPGPGEYPVRKLDGVSEHKRATGITFGSQPRLGSYANSSPSPGDYDPSLGQARRQAPAFSLTGRKKADRLQQRPGPGSYNTDMAAAAAKRSSPAYSISLRRLPDKEAERRPGPQDYRPSLPSGGAPLPGASIKARWAERGQHNSGADEVPGPGAYIPESHELPRGRSPLRYTFGVSRPRPKHEAHPQPGPGDYDEVRASAKLSPYVQRSISVPRAQRFGEGGQYEVRPGPGAYFHSPLIKRPGGHSLESTRRSAPALTMGMKAPPSFSKLSPGPGEYDSSGTAEPRSRSPSFTFRGVHVKDKKVRQPGPGHYQPEAAQKLTRPCEPSVSISHRHEPPRAQGRVPGPGEYSPQLPGSPYAKVSMKFRHEAASSRGGGGRQDWDASPGPHEFADGPLKHGALRGGRAATIGTRLAGAKPQQEQLPAPGEYEVHQSTIGAAVAGDGSC